MSKGNQLTATQQQILEHAIDRTEGRIEWFPNTVKGGAQKTLLGSLKSRGLLQAQGQHHHVTPAAYAAIGRIPPALAVEDGDSNEASGSQEDSAASVARTSALPTADRPAPVAACAGTASDDTAEGDHDGMTESADDNAYAAEKEQATGGVAAPQVPPPKVKPGSKQAKVIAMLKRPEGATIKQIMEATEWQSHTVRGMISGTLRKKLELNVVGEKQEGGQETIYRIV